MHNRATLRKTLLLFGLAVVVASLLYREPIIRAHYNFKRARYLQKLTRLPSWKDHAAEFNRRRATAAAVFVGATKVETYRPVLWFGGPMESGIGAVDGIPYRAKGPTQDGAFAQRLGAIGLEPRTYSLARKACGFRPTVVFRVVNGSRSVSVVLCLGCNQLAVLEKNAPLSEIGGFKGRFKISGEFDAFRPELLQMAKEAFPNDREIQTLPTYKTGLLQLSAAHFQRFDERTLTCRTRSAMHLHTASSTSAHNRCG